MAGKFVALLAAVGLTVMPAAAFSYGSSGTRTIKGFMVAYNWYSIIYSGASNFSNPDGCGNSSMVMVRQSDAWYKDTFAAVMMAQASGQSVVFWLSGCEATSWGYTVPVVQTITVNP